MSDELGGQSIAVTYPEPGSERNEFLSESSQFGCQLSAGYEPQGCRAFIIFFDESRSLLEQSGSIIA